MARAHGNRKGIRNLLLMAAVFGAASCIGIVFRFVGFPDTNIVVTYLLAVLITVWLTNSFITGFLSSILATFAFNYFFAEPLYTFSVNDPNYIITFITMTLTALATSTLTSHAKRSASAAQEKETETKAIYNLTNHLTDTKDMCDISVIAVSAISECFSCRAACLCFDENGVPERTFVQQVSETEQAVRDVADAQEVGRRMECLRAGFERGDEFFDWPIYGRENILGIVRIPKERGDAMDEPQMRLLRSMIESIALAMDRFRSAQQRAKSREETTMERYRANLLRAISHDIRTPLSGIIGTSEMLKGMTEKSDPRYGLAQGIQEDAGWLHALVENILNLTRLQDGRLTIEKQQEAVEELIGEAVNHIARRAPEYEIAVSVPDELLLVPMDAKLMEQVIVNLLDNAIKHTKPEDEIEITVTPDADTGTVRFAVRDRGVGIGEDELPHVFKAFYTAEGENTPVRQGMGLGLAICETIIKAHGGSIEAHNRTDGSGTEFIFTLPMQGVET